MKDGDPVPTFFVGTSVGCASKAVVTKVERLTHLPGVLVLDDGLVRLCERDPPAPLNKAAEIGVVLAGVDQELAW